MKNRTQSFLVVTLNVSVAVGAQLSRQPLTPGNEEVQGGGWRATGHLQFGKMNLLCHVSVIGRPQDVTDKPRITILVLILCF